MEQKIKLYKHKDLIESLKTHRSLSIIGVPEGQLNPLKFTLDQGTNAILDEVWSFLSVNDLKNQWYGAAPPVDMQNGMPFVKNTTGILFLKALGLMIPTGTLPQTDHVANYVILTTDLNSIQTMTNAAARQFTLCSIDATFIGKFIIIGKLGAGQVTILRADADTINGGTQVHNLIADETFSWICLRVISATAWSVFWASNPFSWIVT